MFKIHQRYLAATFIPPFVLSTAFFVFFLLTFQIFRFTAFLVSKGVEWRAMGLLLAHMAVSFLPLAVPLSALLATIYTLNKLSEDSEITAMRSFGASKWALFKPFLILGILIAGTVFSLNKNIIPFSKREVRNTYMKFASNAMLKQIRPEEFFGDIPGLTLYASNVSEDGRYMKDLFLFTKDKKSGEERVIFAKEGALVGGDKGNIGNLSIELKMGSMLRRDDKKREIEKISFLKYSFPAFKKTPTFGFVNKASMKNNKDLKKEINKLARKYKRVKKKTPGARRDLYRNRLEYWSRFNTPLVIMCSIFLGFSVGIKTGRGKEKNSGLLALMVLLPYYGLFFAGIGQAKGGDLFPSVAVFAPTVLFFLAGYWFYRKVDWVS